MLRGLIRFYIRESRKNYGALKEPLENNLLENLLQYTRTKSYHFRTQHKSIQMSRARTKVIIQKNFNAGLASLSGARLSLPTDPPSTADRSQAYCSELPDCLGGAGGAPDDLDVRRFVKN
eukprot:4756994-Pyramimonas_sp.AAC.1